MAALQREEVLVGARAEATTRAYYAGDRPPADLTTPRAQRDRLTFLRYSLEDDAVAQDTFERVLAGDELQPANYLERGSIAARAVARVAIGRPGGGIAGWGTGFLIAPNVLITNHHVLPDAGTGAASQAQFDYELNLADEPKPIASFALQPGKLFFTSVDLDFTVVAVALTSVERQEPLSRFGFLPLLDVTGKAFEGEWLTIVQHPNGERKQLCVRENKLLERTDDFLRYSTDTEPGSSGSPVFNNDWYVVALHHSGVVEQKNGRTQTTDGRDYDPVTMSADLIHWVANEGVRASRIAQALKSNLPTHPLLQPMFNATPASARIRSESAGTSPSGDSTIHTEISSMSIPAPIFAPAADTLSVRPDRRTVEAVLTALSQVQREAAAAPAVGAEAAKKKPPSSVDAPFETDYSNRKGFDAGLLGTGAKRIDLPTMSHAVQAEAQPLLKAGAGHVLNYHNYSVVMHAKRRFAIFSAANVSFAKRYEMGRPPDVWRVDPRISLDVQIQNWYYATNQFDRGHLTRREDLEYGATPVVALQSAADTCHWTNCTPQHSQFNQNKEIWQGIERHVLESAIVAGHFNAQVITGPVLDEGDPEYRKVQYPIQFWKVVAALNTEGNLFATAYIASQQDVIDQFGIEAAEVPFGPYKTFQVKIAEVERLTGLTFTSDGGKTSLSKYDPLALKKAPRRKPAAAAPESLVPGGASGYYEIRELDDIQT